MATKDHLDYTYSTIDQIFRLSMGETGDFSGAKYDGDFSMSLEEAQRAKHDYILKNLKVKHGDRVVDLGCGWGPFLNYLKHHEMMGVGLSLSEGQVKACLKNGFDVRLQDCRNVSVDNIGKFDAAVSLGAFEHFCSVEDFLNGQQELVYQNFFESVSGLLDKGQRLFLQTMTFGKNAIPYQEVNINAPKGSDEYIMGLMVKQFPGSWLPEGPEMVEACAQPAFKLVNKSNGRKDYIETISQWRKKFRAFSLKKYALYASLLPQYLWNKDFRYRVEVFNINPNKICFERELMDHYRFVFEKT